jgi:hypothetical protein
MTTEPCAFTSVGLFLFGRERAMRQITLTHGKVTLVDDEDYDRLMQYNWFAYKHPDRRPWYAMANAGKTVLMHRVILDPEPHLLVDHRDFDGLNNQRYNLRVATEQQSTAHRHMPTSRPYRGVYKHRSIWKARIGHSRKLLYIGSFPTACEAALAYDAMALKLYGEFAVLNLPTEDPSACKPE